MTDSIDSVEAAKVFAQPQAGAIAQAAASPSSPAMQTLEQQFRYNPNYARKSDAQIQQTIIDSYASLLARTALGQPNAKFDKTDLQGFNAPEKQAILSGAKALIRADMHDTESLLNSFSDVNFDAKRTPAQYPTAILGNSNPIANVFEEARFVVVNRGKGLDKNESADAKALLNKTGADIVAKAENELGPITPPVPGAAVPQTIVPVATPRPSLEAYLAQTAPRANIDRDMERHTAGVQAQYTAIKREQNIVVGEAQYAALAQRMEGDSRLQAERTAMDAQHAETAKSAPARVTVLPSQSPQYSTPAIQAKESAVGAGGIACSVACGSSFAENCNQTSPQSHAVALKLPLTAQVPPTSSQTMLDLYTAARNDPKNLGVSNNGINAQILNNQGLLMLKGQFDTSKFTMGEETNIRGYGARLLADDQSSARNVLNSLGEDKFKKDEKIVNEVGALGKDSPINQIVLAEIAKVQVRGIGLTTAEQAAAIQKLNAASAEMNANLKPGVECKPEIKAEANASAPGRTQATGVSDGHSAERVIQMVKDIDQIYTKPVSDKSMTDMQDALRKLSPQEVYTVGRQWQRQVEKSPDSGGIDAAQKEKVLNAIDEISGKQHRPNLTTPAPQRAPGV
jgi:hypothetical protein